MLIERLVFHDFLVFFGTQSLDFATEQDRNVTLILAPNNSGKTTVIRGLEFLLYGEPSSQTLSNLPSQARVAVLAVRETSTAYVEATVRHGAERLRIRRSIAFARRSAADLHVQVLETSLEVLRHEGISDRLLPRSSATQDKIANLVPRAMFDFYFFKGEELANKLLHPASKMEIPAQLKKVLYKREWECVRETLKKADQHFSRQIAAQMQKSSEYDRLILQKEATQRNIEAAKEDLERHRAMTKALTAKWNEADNRISSLVARARPERRRELDRVKAALRDVISRRASARDERRAVLGKDAALLLAAGEAPAAQKYLQQLRHEHVLPPAISEGLLSRIISEQRCICGATCIEGSDGWKAIVRLREGSLAEGVTEDLWKLDGELRSDNQLGVIAKARELKEKLADADRRDVHFAEDEVRLESERRELEDAVDEGAEAALAQAKLERARIKEAIDRSEAAERVAVAQLQRCEQTLSQTETELRRAHAGSATIGYLKEAHSICEKFSDATSRAQDLMVRTIHRELSRSVAEMYDGIVTDGSKAIVDSSSLMPAIQRSGVSGLHGGGGQEQVLLLCYLIALAELRRTINGELRERFAIETFYEQGFFMDSVFGQTQGAYKRAVSKLLPRHMKQLVLLLADQQWDADVEGGVRESLGKVYCFKLHSPKKEADESEYTYTVLGRKRKLVTRIGSDEQAFTSVQPIEIG